MEITVKIDKEEAILAAREFWTNAKKQLEPLVVVVAFAIGTAWLVAGLAAMNLWVRGMGYTSNPSEAGWLVVWLITSGAWIGLFIWRDDS